MPLDSETPDSTRIDSASTGRGPRINPMGSAASISEIDRSPDPNDCARMSSQQIADAFEAVASCLHKVAGTVLAKGVSGHDISTIFHCAEPGGQNNNNSSSSGGGSPDNNMNTLLDTLEVAGPLQRKSVAHLLTVWLAPAVVLQNESPAAQPQAKGLKISEENTDSDDDDARPMRRASEQKNDNDDDDARQSKPPEEEKHDDSDEMEFVMPPGPLRDFKPFLEYPEVRSFAKDKSLVDVQEEVLKNPHDKPALRSLQKHVREIQVAVSKLAAEIVPDGNSRLWSEVIREGNDFFRDVYESVWRVVQRDQTGCATYKKAVAVLRDYPFESDLRNSYDAYTLFRTAAATKPLFDDTVGRIAAGVRGLAAVKIPAKLKSILRIVEKSTLPNVCDNGDYPGFSAPTDTSGVFDVVRAMFVCPSMAVVAETLGQFAGCKEISLVRLKERFFECPSDGGWRDVMICFYIRADAKQHICEVQIVHEQLLTARKGLPGHAVYNHVRSAAEMLRYWSRFGLSGSDSPVSPLTDAGFGSPGRSPALYSTAENAACLVQFADQYARVCHAKAWTDEAILLEAMAQQSRRLAREVPRPMFSLEEQSELSRRDQPILLHVPDKMKADR